MQKSPPGFQYAPTSCKRNLQGGDAAPQKRAATEATVDATAAAASAPDAAETTIKQKPSLPSLLIDAIIARRRLMLTAGFHSLAHDCAPVSINTTYSIADIAPMQLAPSECIELARTDFIWRSFNFSGDAFWALALTAHSIKCTILAMTCFYRDTKKGSALLAMNLSSTLKTFHNACADYDKWPCKNDRVTPPAMHLFSEAITNLFKHADIFVDELNDLCRYVPQWAWDENAPFFNTDGAIVSAAEYRSCDRRLAKLIHYSNFKNGVFKNISEFLANTEPDDYKKIVAEGDVVAKDILSIADTADKLRRVVAEQQQQQQDTQDKTEAEATPRASD